MHWLWHKECTGHRVTQQHLGAPAEVVHGAIQLARAEVKVALAHGRAFAVQAGLALVLSLFSMAMLQAALILTVLSPLLFDRLSTSMALGALAVPYLGAIAGGGLAFLSWRKACQPPISTRHGAALQLATQE